MTLPKMESTANQSQHRDFFSVERAEFIDFDEGADLWSVVGLPGVTGQLVPTSGRLSYDGSRELGRSIASPSLRDRVDVPFD